MHAQLYNINLLDNVNISRFMSCFTHVFYTKTFIATEYLLCNLLCPSNIFVVLRFLRMLSSLINLQPSVFLHESFFVFLTLFLILILITSPQLSEAWKIISYFNKYLDFIRNYYLTACIKCIDVYYIFNMFNHGENIIPNFFANCKSHDKNWIFFWHV